MARRKPDAVHPGEYLKLTLTERGLSQRSVALATGVSDSYLSDVLHLKRGVSVSLALRLERAFREFSAEFWLTMQMRYDLEIARAQKGGEG